MVLRRVRLLPENASTTWPLDALFGPERFARRGPIFAGPMELSKLLHRPSCRV